MRRFGWEEAQQAELDERDSQQNRTVCLLAAVIRSIPEENREEAIWSLASEQYFSSDELKKVVDKLLIDSCTLAEGLQKYLSEKRLRPDNSTYQKIARAVTLLFYEELERDKRRSFSDESMLMYDFRHALYFLELVQKTDSVLAEKYFRMFGGLASDDLIAQIIDANPNLPLEYKNALAEGANRRSGAFTVYQNHLDAISHNAKMRETIKAKKTKFRNLVNQGALGEALHAAFDELEQAMGYSQSRQWLHDNFPHMIGGWEGD